MSGQYTPGPWVDVGEDELDGYPFIVIETDQPTGPLCRSICEVQPTYNGISDEFVIDDEVRANARLIAAAPDLLEALACEEVDLTLLHRAIDEGDPKAELLIRASDSLRRVRAAISKALHPVRDEGGES